MSAIDAPWLPRVVRWLWVVGFTVGTVSHLWDVFSAGIRVYEEYSGAIRAFWLALTLVDPVVVCLVLFRRRSGIVLGVLTVVIDYVVDVSVSLPLSAGGMSGGLVRLTLFRALVFATGPTLWRLYAPDRRR